MIPHEVISLLNTLKRECKNNQPYYEHKKSVIELIYSFNSPEECWKKLRGSDAYILLKKEQKLLDHIKSTNPAIFFEIEIKAECHRGSL